MNSVKFIVGLVSKTFKASVDAVQRVTGTGRDGEELDGEGWAYYQNHGFYSRPPKDAQIIWIKQGAKWIGIASDSRNKPEIEEGETALFFDKDNFITIHDGKITLKTKGDFEIEAENLTITGNLKAKGEVEDGKGALSKLRDNYNSHKHIGNMGAPTSPSDLPDV
tara:strand:+ start:193 stop:687 length:495 start_codon:yes stop_codon:yes gene_type:complete